MLTYDLKTYEFTNDEYQQTIEEKDNQVQGIKYKKVALQAQRDVYQAQLQRCQDLITHLTTRYVDHAKDPGKDNIVMIIEKNSTPQEDEFYEYLYYIARIQRRFISKKDGGLWHNICIIGS